MSGEYKKITSYSNNGHSLDLISAELFPLHRIRFCAILPS